MLEQFSALIANSESFRSILKGIAGISLAAVIAQMTKMAIAMIFGSSAMGGYIGMAAGLVTVGYLMSALNSAGAEAGKNTPRYANLEQGNMVHLKQMSIADPGETIVNTNDMQEIQNNSLSLEQGDKIIELLNQRQSIRYDKFAANNKETMLGFK